MTVIETSPLLSVCVVLPLYRATAPAGSTDQTMVCPCTGFPLASTNLATKGFSVAPILATWLFPLTICTAVGTPGTEVKL